ncbi:hypothetical protein G5V59_16200 [Nocardioides sp. W3-2-3]|uniref:hypothetical protein n=1 Tax=Nocardioides convexus TaxID=2712224 RepID=UPI002418A69C|nr:hypothetical protein [Nocardioides convexus]NHA00931.1 hypothetical protein [Nocardioides convexus]
MWLRERLAERGSPVSLTTLSLLALGTTPARGPGLARGAGGDRGVCSAWCPASLLDLVGDSRRTVPVGKAVRLPRRRAPHGGAPDPGGARRVDGPQPA